MTTMLYQARKKVRRSHLCYATLALMTLHVASCKASQSSTSSDVKEVVSSPLNCENLSKEILSNGIWQDQNPTDITNGLIAATLAHHAYPYAWQGTTMEETLGGLSPSQIARYHRNFRSLWQPLGADTIEFIEFDRPEQSLEANAVVLGTKKDVFVVFRGVSRMGQLIQSFRHTDVVGAVGGQNIRLWSTNFLAYQGIIDRVDQAVLKARSKTANPDAAKIWLIGHSSGGAYSALSALDLTYRHPKLKIAGIYTFGANMTGFDCEPGETCLSSLYNPRFGAITYRWVNDNDMGPFLPTKQIDDQRWAHVPSAEHGIFRITGPTCERVYGKLTENCIESLKKPDGLPIAGGCNPVLGDHMSSIYLIKIKQCYQAASRTKSGDQRHSCTSQLLGREMLKTNDLK